MKTKRILSALIALLGLAVLQGQAQQLTINIRYTGENGGARKYVEEMESSGIAARIRAIEGCLAYDYFYPADDPEGLLLIDSWENQEALNRYHASPAMQEAAALREKYGLGNRTVRMFTPMMPGRRQNPPQQSDKQ
jgi:quinol monooxygenase YgiN